MKRRIFSAALCDVVAQDESFLLSAGGMFLNSDAQVISNSNSAETGGEGCPVNQCANQRTKSVFWC
jgi:hypothetical protein